jgi:hypothetical protein
LEIIDLGQHGQYLMANLAADRKRLLEAIQAGIQDQQLDEAWRAWRGTATVSVAVPLDSEIARYRTYTFLPLGVTAPAPFAGHLNAPFQTTLARDDLHQEEHLNHFLLDLAAEACLRTAEYLQSHEGPRADNAIVDLLSWRDARRSHLERACQRLFGRPLSQYPMVPVVRSQQQPRHLVSPETAYEWPAQCQTLTGTLAVSTTDAALLRAGLGEARTKRLVEFVSSLGQSLTPPASVLAGWVEAMVGSLPRDDLDDLELWEQVYDDLAALFSDHPQALHRRTLLLDEHAALRACNAPERSANGEATAFFPPDDRADVGVPEVLRRRFFCLHPGLWQDTSRRWSPFSPGRWYLSRHGLSEEFDTEGILDHVQAALQAPLSPAEHAELLRFVFRLEHDDDRSGISGGVSLDQLGLHVPTESGRWIPASQARFSAGWPGTSGGKLAAVIAAAAPLAADLDQLQQQMIVAPSDLASIFRESGGKESGGQVRACLEGWPGVRCRQVGEKQPIPVTRLAAWTGSELGVHAGVVVDRGCRCGRHLAGGEQRGLAGWLASSARAGPVVGRTR